MRDICNEHENKIKESEDVASKLRLKYEEAQKKIEELNGKIKFLEGQIEAYQYCMNCHR